MLTLKNTKKKYFEDNLQSECYVNLEFHWKHKN